MRKIKEIVKRLKRNLMKIIKSFDKNVYISIGENCLSDNILERNGLKSFSSPYSSARSNIEYILAYERESFVDFLNTDFLQYEELPEGKKVVRNKKHISIDNCYCSSCSKGFEFTHHDTIGSNNTRNKMLRRCQRMMSLKGKNITMLYHHRLCEETNEDLLISHLSQLAKLYEAKNNIVSIYAFSQIVVENPNQRKVERTEKRIGSSNIYTYKFYTLDQWAGNDQNIFWARNDDDLIETMIEDIKSSRRKQKRFSKKVNSLIDIFPFLW